MAKKKALILINKIAGTGRGANDALDMAAIILKNVSVEILCHKSRLRVIDMNMRNDRKLNTQEQEFVQSLYSSHFKTLLNYARRLGFADEVAEDYVQETFLIAMQRVEVVMECRDPRSYLFKILKNRPRFRLKSPRCFSKKWLKSSVLLRLLSRRRK